MSRPPPQPIFVHHGFMGGVTSCALISYGEFKGLLIGTGTGRCELYDDETHTFIRTVYVDDQKRAISSLGIYNGFLLVHVRNNAVFLLGSDDEVRHVLRLSHCGYCRVAEVGSFLVYPDSVREEHFLRFFSLDSGNQNQIEVKLKYLPLSIVSVGDALFVGDEAGAITQISAEGKSEAEVSLFTEPVFCVAATSSCLACSSSKPPILLLPTANIYGDSRKINYPPSSRGVGSVTFSTSGKTLLAGFWDGSIRAYSVQKLTILVYLNLHTESISQLLWSEVNGEDRVTAASQDEKVSLWKLK